MQKVFKISCFFLTFCICKTEQRRFSKKKGHSGVFCTAGSFHFLNLYPLPSQKSGPEVTD